MPYASVVPAFATRLVTALAFVGLWWLLIAWEPAKDLDILLLTVVLTVTSAVTGWLTKSWWALLLPLLVLPVFALPSAYTPGADPEYGVGLFVAGLFTLVAVPSIAVGVVLSR